MKEHTYAAAWRDLGRRESILKVVSWLIIIPELVFVPLILVAFLIFDLLSIRSLPWQFSLFVLMTTLGFIGLLCILLSFRCPRCRKLFFFKQLYFFRTPRDRNHCVHCGLAKGSVPDVPDSQTITAHDTSRASRQGAASGNN